MYLRRFCVILAIALFGGGCAHDLQLPRVSETCDAAPETYMSSSRDEYGHEVVVERFFPAREGCEDLLVTRLRYDVRGELVGRADDLLLCGVPAGSMVAVRSAEGWAVERERHLDDPRVDELVPASAAAGLSRFDSRGPALACALAGESAPPAAPPLLAEVWRR